MRGVHKWEARSPADVWHLAEGRWAMGDDFGTLLCSLLLAFALICMVLCGIDGILWRLFGIAIL